MVVMITPPPRVPRIFARDVQVAFAKSAPIQPRPCPVLHTLGPCTSIGLRLHVIYANSGLKDWLGAVPAALSGRLSHRICTFTELKAH